MKALSGTVNFNTFPKGRLQNSAHYKGRRIPAVRSARRYAGAGMFLDEPVNSAYPESKIKSMRRQARPYGVY